jgi:hypothetical protein
MRLIAARLSCCCGHPTGTREEGPNLSLKEAVGQQPENMAVARGFEELVK